jgi:Ca-activated chloride channel family protein
MKHKLLNLLPDLISLFASNAIVLWFWFRAANMYEFETPVFLWGLFIVPLLGIWLIYKKYREHPTVKLSSFGFIPTGGFAISKYLAALINGIILIAVGLFFLVMARPQTSRSWENISTEGIDIVIAMDISASMLAKDFKPNRLEASKEVAIDFIEERPTDRVGLVVYEGEAFTQCPLTTDHRVLINLMEDIKTGMVEGGTAIGSGLATAVNRLKDSEVQSKVVILLTDGVNNSGNIPPLTAAEIAKEFGIRVYTIGVGSKGRAYSPVSIAPNGQYRYDLVEVKIDEKVLQNIADITDGEYFRATDNNSLASIYAEIDKLEKTKIEVTQHSKKSDRFFDLALIAVVLILVAAFLQIIVLRFTP